MSDNNPYSPPASTESQPQTSAPLSLAAHANHCRWGAGLDWIKEGGALFLKAPRYLWTITMLYLLIVITMSLVPVVSLFANFLGLPLMAGVLYACMALDRQDQRKYGFLFIGFQQRLKHFILLSLLYFLGIIVIIVSIGVIAALVIGFDQLNLDQLEQFTSPSAENPPDPIMLMYVLAAVLMGMLLMLPLFMGIWFAPALILFNELTATQAFGTSFKGCLKNMGSLTVWGLSMSVIFLLALLPLGLGLLVLPAFSFCTFYFCYKGIFLTPDEQQL